MRMFSYCAYGLNIRSQIQIPELTSASGRADVVITLDPTPPSPALLEEETFVRVDDLEITLGFRRAGVFRAIGGREIVISLAPGADLALARLYLLGKVLASLLYQRGLLVLHASAVDVSGQAVAFMGISCVGKSSLAAALVRSGQRLVADDLTAIECRKSGVMALSGFPQLKLDPVVVRSLGFGDDAGVSLHKLEGRRGLRVEDAFTLHPVRLSLIYLIGSDEESQRPLTPQDRIIELVRHSFPARLQQSGGRRHLEQCVAIARSVPMLRLGVAEARVAPRELSERVRRDLASLTAGSPTSDAVCV
jgi:hypothetical protein